MKPAARTLDFCKRMGWTRQTVEKWVAFGKRVDDDGAPGGVRVDLFGFADVLAVAREDPITGRQAPFFLFIQACALSGASAHVAKARAEERLRDVIAAGGEAEVWAWGTGGARGRAKRVRLVRIDLSARRQYRIEVDPKTGGERRRLVRAGNGPGVRGWIRPASPPISTATDSGNEASMPRLQPEWESVRRQEDLRPLRCGA